MTDSQDAGPRSAQRSGGDAGATPGDPPSSEAGPTPAASRPALAWIAVAVAALALVLAIVAWYQVAVTARLEVGRELQRVEGISQGFDSLRDAQAELRRQVEELGQRLDGADAGLRDRVQELQAAVDGRLVAERSARDQALTALRGDFDALRSSVDEVYEELGRSVDSWLVEEVEQLLLLAQQRLALDGDAELATAALQIADAKLRDIGAPDLIEVRRAIAAKLAELDAVERTDVAGIALELHALAGAAGDWPWREDAGAPDWQAAAEDTQPAQDDGGWQEVGREILDDLQRLVRIRRVDDSRLPKLEPGLRLLVVEQARLLLFSAQAAVLRGRGEAFAASLDEASRLIERFFDTEAQAVAGALAALARLRGASVSPGLPDIGEPLVLLRQATAERAVPAQRGEPQ